MPRSTNNPATRARRKKVLTRAKGFRQSRSKVYQFAKEFSEKALDYSWRDRRQRKRSMRSRWIIRVNIAARQAGLTYRELINGLKKAQVELNRKMLAELALKEPDAFRKLAELAKQNLS